MEPCEECRVPQKCSIANCLHSRKAGGNALADSLANLPMDDVEREPLPLKKKNWAVDLDIRGNQLSPVLSLLEVFLHAFWNLEPCFFLSQVLSVSKRQLSFADSAFNFGGHPTPTCAT